MFHVHVHVHLPSLQDARPPVPWRHTVEGADSTTHTEGTRGGGARRCEGGGRQQVVLARSQPLPARTYRGRPAAFAPRSLSIGLARRFFGRRCVDFLRVPAQLHLSLRLCCPLAGCPMWIPGCVRVAIVLGVARPGVVVGIEQGATMLDTPAASGRPAPLACWPLAGPRWLRTTPFSRDPGERRRRLRGDALGGTGGTEVKLALLAVVSPRTLKRLT